MRFFRRGGPGDPLYDAAAAEVEAAVAVARPFGVVLVGQINPYGPAPANALLDYPEGSSGARLRDILGLRSETYRALPRYNLCDYAWRMGAARARAKEIDAAHPGDVLVLLGRDVQGAFKVRAEPFTSTRLVSFARTSSGPWVQRDAPVVALPHPSGLCREWNEPGAVRRARAVLKLLCPDLPLGEEGDRP